MQDATAFLFSKETQRRTAEGGKKGKEVEMEKRNLNESSTQYSKEKFFYGEIQKRLGFTIFILAMLLLGRGKGMGYKKTKIEKEFNAKW